MKFLSALTVFLLTAGTYSHAQQTSITCPGGNVTTTLPNGQITVVCTGTPPPVTIAPVITSFNVNPSTITLGSSITFTYTVTGNPTPTVSIDNGVGIVTSSPKVFAPSTTGQIMYTITATNSAGSAPPKNWTVTVNPSAGEPIYPGEVTDANLLGNCTVERHNSYLVSGGDGFRYWKWHPQSDPSGCVYAHEHGHDPTPVLNALIAHFQSIPVTPDFTQAMKDERLAYLANPKVLLMGYATRRAPGHPPEPHGGFKIFYALYNEQNDEGRFSTMLSLHMTHMGTGGVLRFTQPHHSVQSIQVHIPSGAYQITPLMLNFGTADMVCDPRNGPNTRDFIVINTSRCKINSPYEIWVGSADIKENGQTLFRAFSTPAVFDPITVHNLQNSSEVVYAWDTRVMATRAFPTPSWMDFKGCNREAYAQPGNYNVTGHQTRWTDAFGNVVAQGPNAIQQFFYSPVVTSDLRGSTPVGGQTQGNHAFKKPRANCNLAGSLKLLN
jgi:hypothetical protein